MIYLVEISTTPPDGWFWYALSLLFAGVLCVIIYKSYKKFDIAIDRLDQNIKLLSTKLENHHVKIENHTEDIKQIKDKVFNRKK